MLGRTTTESHLALRLRYSQSMSKPMQSPTFMNSGSKQECLRGHKRVPVVTNDTDRPGNHSSEHPPTIPLIPLRWGGSLEMVVCDTVPKRLCRHLRGMDGDLIRRSAGCAASPRIPDKKLRAPPAEDNQRVHAKNRHDVFSPVMTYSHPHKISRSVIPPVRRGITVQCPE